MKKLFILLFTVLNGLSVLAQKPAPVNHYQLITDGDWVKTKNYYLLTLIQQDKAVSQTLKTDAVLKQFTQKKLADLKNSVTDCKDAACFTDKIKFSDEEIKTVGAELEALCKPGSALEKLVKNKLIPSGTYGLYKGSTASQLLVKAWEQDAAGINYTIGVYGDGKKPNYPLIDSISFNTKGRRYAFQLSSINETLYGDVKGASLFFEPAMQAALLFLQLNERQDAANYEPMAQTVNKAAVKHIKVTNWAKYPYTVILIPGEGPENLTTPLSAGGMLRCRLAAQQYRAGLAPFVMPSGGKVHPYKTKYCEAEEMKKYLVEVLHIPAYAVIMEPHARHTTTNMRNGVRLMYRYGIPDNKPGLVVTERGQAGAIINMAGRCMKELGYVPYKLGKPLSPTATEFYPLPEAMQIDLDEPLDP